MWQIWGRCGNFSLKEKRLYPMQLIFLKCSTKFSSFWLLRLLRQLIHLSAEEELSVDFRQLMEIYIRQLWPTLTAKAMLPAQIYQMTSFAHYRSNNRRRFLWQWASLRLWISRCIHSCIRLRFMDLRQFLSLLESKLLIKKIFSLHLEWNLAVIKRVNACHKKNFRA